MDQATPTTALRAARIPSVLRNLLDRQQRETWWICLAAWSRCDARCRQRASLPTSRCPSRLLFQLDLSGADDPIPCDFRNCMNCAKSTSRSRVESVFSVFRPDDAL
jgi:hypothetical protein